MSNSIQHSHADYLQNLSQKDHILISSIAGGFSSLLIDFIVFPIDTIKTRVQASSSRIDFIKKNKSLSKYNGVYTIILGGFPSGFLFFAIYDYSKIILTKYLQNELISNIFAASIAELIANIYRTPLELTKQQMQVGWNKSITATVRSIYQQNGLKGFYSGFGPQILREIPFSTIEYPIYEMLKRRQQKRHGLSKDSKSTICLSMINGFIASAISAFLTNPIDVVKSRIMTQRDHYYKNVFDGFKKIIMKESIRELSKGALLRTLTLGTSGSVFFLMYEQFKNILHYSNQQNRFI